MPKYPFLSDEWVEEARHIYGRAQANGPLVEGATLSSARVNLIVNDAPFSAGPVQAHVDTSEGRLQIDTGHLDKPDVTISMSYETARSLFVAGDMQSVMQAFLGGRIRVDGDLSKLLDPRNGIFPANLGLGARPAASVGLSPFGAAGLAANTGGAGGRGDNAPDVPSAPAGAGADVGSDPSGPAPLDLPMSSAQDVARQLQEITE